jgi:hypothetical protein
MDQGPNSRFYLASSYLYGMKFVFCLEINRNLVEARVAGHGYLVVLASDPKAPICVAAWRRTKYEEILQFAALFVQPGGGQHQLAQLLFILSFFDHLPSPHMQFIDSVFQHRLVFVSSRAAFPKMLALYLSDLDH